jgi:Leucine-rich repeat (LRR) protein
MDNIDESRHNYQSFGISELPVILPDTLKILDCSVNEISLLTYMPISLEHLDCSNNVLISIASNVLPSTLRTINISRNRLSRLDLASLVNLRRIDCSFNFISHVSNIPINLKELYCSNNIIRTVPLNVFPRALEILDISRNRLFEINEYMPKYLKKLNCSENGILTIKKNCLNNIEEIDCSRNLLTSLSIGIFSQKLKTLECYNNLIYEIEPGCFPDTLEYLDCSNNVLNRIEKGVLPTGLKTLRILNNHGLIRLENIPIGLVELVCNNIYYVDNLSVHRIKFSLKGYQSIRRIQKRMKRRFKRKLEAVLLIQRKCHNWLWAPVCKDGKIGIHLRMDLLDLF